MDYSQFRFFSPELNRLAKKYGIKKLYVIGSISRGDSGAQSDVDFLVDMMSDSSLFGVGGFCYEAEKIFGTHLDVIPRSVLPCTENRNFVANIERDAIAL